MEGQCWGETSVLESQPEDSMGERLPLSIVLRQQCGCKEFRPTLSIDSRSGLTGWSAEGWLGAAWPKHPPKNVPRLYNEEFR